MLLEMWAQPFMRHAFIAGSVIALACGLVGAFVLLRGQLFAGDALSHVAFTGALAAALVGLGPQVGLFGACAAVAAVLAWVGARGRSDDVATGSVFAFVLGVGVLCLSLFTTAKSGGQSAVVTSTLFGSILGLSVEATWGAVVVSVGAVVVLLLIARPLLFATIDEGVASARGVPTRMLGLVFLLVLGVVAAEAAQAVGALLLLGLIAAPAAAALRVARGPWMALALSGGLAVVSMCVGLAVSFVAPSVPPSFAIITTASAVYGVAQLARS